MPILSCLGRVKRTKTVDGYESRPKAAADIQIFRYRIDRSGSMSSMETEAYEGTIDYLFLSTFIILFLIFFYIIYKLIYKIIY